MVRIQHEPIDCDSIRNAVQNEECGAVVLFLGTTRRYTDSRETIKLEYDCYEPMALAELEKLRSQSMVKWPISKCVIVHRLGVVENGEASIVVALSSPHRREAFDAAQWIMDEVKRTIPIWKKEHWTNGSTEWVHPEPRL